MPEAAEKYTAIEGMSVDDPVFQAMSTIALENNVSDGAFQAMQTKIAEMAVEAEQAKIASYGEALDAWQLRNPQISAAVASTMQTAGVSGEQMGQAMVDPAAFYDIIGKIATSVTGEKPAIPTPGDSTSFKMTPEQATAEIEKKLGDEKFLERYHNDNAKIRNAPSKK